MKPEIWGPHAWMFLHSITLEYPEEPTEQDKQDMIIFIKAVGNVLPCKKCRDNFKTHVQKYPLDNAALSSRKNLVKWLIDIHNCVNGIKKCRELSYEEALNTLLENYSDNSENNSMFWIYVFLLILFLAIIGLIIFNC